MGRHRTLSPEFIARVREVAIARRRLPSDKQLAAEGGVSVRTVQTLMQCERARAQGAPAAHSPPEPQDVAESEARARKTIRRALLPPWHPSYVFSVIGGKRAVHEKG